jgi:sarcosine dehydrogenase
LYDRLEARGAVFGSKLGWERANWFAPPGAEPRDEYAMGRQNWFAAVGEEHRAARERVAVFDQSSFAKFDVSGADAERALSFLCAGDVGKPPGQLSYTQLLNSRGGIECDLTVARLAADRFTLVTGTGFRTHDAAWIRDHIPRGLEVSLADVTEQRATLAVMGPRARDLLARISPDDLSNAAFPFGHVRKIPAAGREVIAMRVTYVGELGWELHMEAADATAVFDALMKEGESFAIAPAGYRAIESLRLEKGYRAWGADITPNDNPFEAGLGFAVSFRADRDFLGRVALLEARDKPLTKRLASFVCDDEDVVLIGRETILRDGEPVGYLSSGGYGYTLGRPIGLGYIKRAEGVSEAWALGGAYELVVAQERRRCWISFAPLYDPKGVRVKS